MLVKTDELIGDALDYAVHSCERNTLIYDYLEPLTDDERYSTNIALAYPIILREGISLRAPDIASVGQEWCAMKRGTSGILWGPDPIVAAMRCHVRAVRGSFVAIPDKYFTSRR